MDCKASPCKSEPRNIVMTCECARLPLGQPAPPGSLLLQGPSHSAWHTVGRGAGMASGRETPILYRKCIHPWTGTHLWFLLAVFYSYLGLLLFSMKVFLTEWGSHVPSWNITLPSLSFHYGDLKLSSHRRDIRRGLLEISGQVLLSKYKYVLFWCFLLSLPGI